MQPRRNIADNNKLFVSPAMGTVVSVNTWQAGRIAIAKGNTGMIHAWTNDIGPSGHIISIHLSLTDEHVQRAPVASQMVYCRHRHGKFNNALTNINRYGIRFENEHNEMLFRNGGLQYKVIQIAGFLARRTRCFLSPGQLVDQGDVIGAITFGSQVSVILPASVTICTSPGQRVTDGETVLALL